MYRDRNGEYEYQCKGVKGYVCQNMAWAENIQPSESLFDVIFSNDC